jgi:hypothetical protein
MSGPGFFAFLRRFLAATHDWISLGDHEATGALVLVVKRDQPPSMG